MGFPYRTVTNHSSVEEMTYPTKKCYIVAHTHGQFCPLYRSIGRQHGKHKSSSGFAQTFFAAVYFQLLSNERRSFFRSNDVLHKVVYVCCQEVESKYIEAPPQKYSRVYG